MADITHMAKEELLRRLLDEAFSVLEHDTSPEEAGHVYERAVLKKRFAAVLTSEGVFGD